MTEEERRRRLGIQTTPEYEDYLIRVAQARAAGLPDPAPLVGVPTKEAQPTSRAAMMQPGEQRLIRPYVDPRDEMIASSPALVRPAYSILDRMLRPGRAGMADRMNREYMDGLLQRDADQRMSAAKLQEQQATAAVTEVQRRAAEGDQDAIDQLREYSKAMYAGRGTGSGNENFEDLLTRSGLQGGLPTDAQGGAEPIAAEGTTPALTNVSDMTRTEFNAYATNRYAEIDNEIKEKQKIIDTEKIESFRRPRLRAGRIEREATFGEIQAARERLKQLQKEKQQLEYTAQRHSPNEAPKG